MIWLHPFLLLTSYFFQSISSFERYYNEMSVARYANSDECVKYYAHSCEQSELSPIFDALVWCRWFRWSRLLTCCQCLTVRRFVVYRFVFFFCQLFSVNCEMKMSVRFWNFFTIFPNKYVTPDEIRFFSFSSLALICVCARRQALFNWCFVLRSKILLLQFVIYVWQQ